jgi:L-iditol 2-dehydrogenase
MKAIQFRIPVPPAVVGLSRDLESAIARIYPPILWSGLSCAHADVPEPQLPAEDWVKIKTRYGGICGSDLGGIHLKSSPYYSVFTSTPFTFGHENVGRIAAVGSRVRDWQVGDRVVVEPTLWCEPRGFDDLCPYCARGEINLCQRSTEGGLAPGIMIGYCRDTGGSWGAYFAAHQSQLYRVPDDVDDENALMVEPFSVALHAVLQDFPGDDETVLVVGAGAIGLLTVAALRALGSHARILVLARYPFQAEAALRLGATEIIRTGGDHDHYAEIARRTGAQLHTPIMGKRVMVGGADRTFECVGGDHALDDAVRLTRSGGHVVLVGVPGIPKTVDWTAIFVNELDVRGSYIYNHAESFNGKKWKAFDLALDLMQHGELDVSWMVTHKFRLDDYARAFRLLDRRSASGAIRAVFEFDE